MKSRDRHRKQAQKQSHTNEASRAAIDLDGMAERVVSVSRRELAGVAAAVLVVLLVGLGVFRESIGFITSPSTDEVALVTEEFDDGAVTFEGAEVTGEPLRTEFGLATGPGRPWSITWSGETVPGAVPLARLHAMAHPQVRSEVIFRKGDGAASFPLWGSVNGSLITAEALDGDEREFSVTFVSVPGPDLQQPAFVLDRVVIGSRVFPKGELQPNFYQFVYLLLFPGIAFVAARAMVRDGRLGAGVAMGLVVTAVVLAGVWPTGFSSLYWATCAAAVAAICVAYYRREDRGRSLGWAEVLCAAGVCAVMLPLRWDLFVSAATLPLPPDSSDYMELAAKMRHPLDTKYREPGFIWAIRLWFMLTAWTPLCIRMFTVLLSLAGGFMAWRVMRLFASPVIALAVVAAMAVNPALIGSSVHGLREEIFPLGLLVYAYCAIMYGRTGGRNWFMGMVVAAAMLPLVRLSALPLVVVTTALVLWRAKAGVRRWIVAAAALAVAVVPFAIYQAGKYGDPLYSSNTYVGTYYKNLEFQDQPGHPTSDEVAVDRWAGEQVGMREYMFGMHSAGEVLARITSGTVSLLAGKSAREDLMRLNPEVSINYQGRILMPEARPGPHEMLLVGLWLIGIVALCWRPFGWVVALCVLGIQVPLGFLEGSNLINWRFTMNVVPFMLVAAGYGVVFLMTQVRRMMEPGEAGRSREVKRRGRPS